MPFANSWFAVVIVLIVGSTANGQMVNGMRDPVWERATAVTRMLGLKPMPRHAIGAVPTRELRVFIEESFKVPYQFLRIVDSGGAVTIERGLWWDGAYLGLVRFGNDRDTTGAVSDDPRLYAERRAIVGGLGCDSIRVRPRIEACLLSAARADARSVLASLDSLGVFHMPPPDVRSITPDGWSISIESWDGRRYQWTWFQDPDAKSRDPHVRAAAEIARRMKRLFTDAASRRTPGGR